MAKAKGGLGRGLGALLPEYDDVAEEKVLDPNSIVQLPVQDISPNPDQPRKKFDEDQLADLVESVKIHGVIQPILVVAREEGFLIVAGERRWRAARKAGLETIPAVIRDFTDAQIFEIALIENIQRAELSVLEEAQGYQYLQDRFGYSQEQLSEKVGKSRSAITNSVRLLALPEDVQELLEEGKVTVGHVRPLLSINSPGWQSQFAHEIYQSHLSVREVEKMVAEVKKRGQVEYSSTEILFQNEPPAIKLSADLKSLQEQMRDKLGTKVLIKNTGKKGKLEIEFYGEEDLKRIIDVLGGEYY